MGFKAAASELGTEGGLRTRTDTDTVKAKRIRIRPYPYALETCLKESGDHHLRAGTDGLRHTGQGKANGAAQDDPSGPDKKGAQPDHRRFQQISDEAVLRDGQERQRGDTRRQGSSCTHKTAGVILSCGVN